jgi:hypothetical protein
VSCYPGRLSHFKILKVADDTLFGSNSKLIWMQSQLFHTFSHVFSVVYWHATKWGSCTLSCLWY